MLRDQIQTQLERLPEAVIWPELVTIFQRTEQVPHPDWEIPMLTCTAVGGAAAAGLPGAAAIACLQISIMLVDDMLDDDPRGEHHRHGPGEAANLSLAYQAAALRLVGQAPVSDGQRAAAADVLAQAALATAAGQHLDVQNLTGETNYWRVVAAKSTPFYGAAYALGAILGGGETAVVDGLYQLGVIIGEIIQIEDDLTDALQKPANADWQQERNNLLILYATTADHPQRQRFLELRARYKEPQALHEAQKILVASGAVSYAAYQLVQRYQAARRQLDALDLPHAAPLQEILTRYAESSLTGLLQAGDPQLSRAELLKAMNFP